MTKADAILSCTVAALLNKKNAAIKNFGPYFSHYVSEFHTSNGILFMEDKIVAPTQLWAPIISSLHKDHASMFRMWDVASNYFETTNPDHAN